MKTASPPQYEGLRPPGSGPDDRDPRTRKKMAFWDRAKIIIFLVAAFLILTVKTMGEFEGIMTFWDALVYQAEATGWILWLIGIDLIRQLHFLISERSAGYHRLWTKGIFGGFDRWVHRRFSDWTRYRLSRAIKVVFWITLIAFILAEVLPGDVSPVMALFQAPALLWQAMPMIAQLAFAFFFIVFQFIGLFWFLSRGGVETYFPDDIKTRFEDVWGQDHVVERVKENIVFLERPDEIEQRGGYVPSGLLLWGPPGTGKTLMAEAVAGETGKPYVFVDPGAFTNMFMGIGILKVKSLFRKLRKLALRYGGVIVFFDEADSLGRRGSLAQQGPRTGPSFSPAFGDACHGFSYLSEGSRQTLLRESMQRTEEEAPRTRTSRFMMGGNMMGGGGDMGTLQALLTELSGLKKPRGIVNRHVRRLLGMRPKPPPKYRILVMMATNMPDALDEALLRPGRIDRIYKVGYPSKPGRIRTYQGYFNKVRHELTDENIDKLATITPYATGATIKDLVNESLITAIRDGREVITWADVTKAKRLKQLGPPEDVEYIERERHAVAVHEACHAVVSYRTTRHFEIDIATIEKGAGYLGMVSSIKPEDQFTRWKSEFEADIKTSLASLVGERMFFGDDNSSGVSGDLDAATYMTAVMETRYGMGMAITALPAMLELGLSGVGQPAPRKKGPGGNIGFLAGNLNEPRPDGASGVHDRIEQGLARLYEETEELLRANRAQVLAVAHALETQKTLNGEDVIAIIERTTGPLVDGTVYADEDFQRELEEYHEAAVAAHQGHTKVTAVMPMPRVRQLSLQPAGVAGNGSVPAFAPAGTITGEIVPVNGNGSGSVDFVPWANTNGNGVPLPPPPPDAAAAKPGSSRSRGLLWGLFGAALALAALVLVVIAVSGGAMNGATEVVPGLPTGTVVVFFLILLGIVAILAIVVGVIRAQQANRRRAEEARDRANERAQLLAAAMDPEVAMRLLGYDGREK
ncbi:AAA family ATPase [Herbidospora galbida]|uniref:AAA family ATPase n=1 Tax=Herbidospora galbida TaxID=2575442 RepID=A0A4U3LSC8_9ACTN|nr:AAA family ATPase [Herbidospora galbida]TKK78881.1 AAA family ATPase [Herbidospora galbida]